MKVVYGIEAKEEDDEFVTVAEAAVNAAVEGLEFPGKFFVEYFPFLRHIPAWLPGASSQRLSEMWQAVNEKSVSMPYAYAKENMVSSSAFYTNMSLLLTPRSRTPARYNNLWLDGCCHHLELRLTNLSEAKLSESRRQSHSKVRWVR